MTTDPYQIPDEIRERARERARAFVAEFNKRVPCPLCGRDTAEE